MEKRNSSGVVKRYSKMTNMKTINKIKKEIEDLRTELMKRGIYKPFASWQKSNIFKFFQLELQLQTSQDIYDEIDKRIENIKDLHPIATKELRELKSKINGENKKW